MDGWFQPSLEFGRRAFRIRLPGKQPRRTDKRWRRRFSTAIKPDRSVTIRPGNCPFALFSSGLPLQPNRFTSLSPWGWCNVNCPELGDNRLHEQCEYIVDVGGPIPL